MAFGHVAGGFARGFTAGAGVATQRDELALRRQQLEQATLSELRTAAQERINATFTAAGKIYEGFQTQLEAEGGLMPIFKKGIAGIESGGDYAAVGPEITNPESQFVGQRAYGKYQVMEQNVRDWTEELYGEPMEPEEFLASPEVQEAVFDYKFGQYVEQYGPQKAARAWFGFGKGDGYMTGEEYERRFMQTVMGSPVKGMTAVVNDLIDSVRWIATKAGIDIAPQEKLLRAQIAALPTQLQKKMAEGRAAGASKHAERQQLIAGGTPEDEAARLAGTREAEPTPFRPGTPFEISVGDGKFVKAVFDENNQVQVVGSPYTKGPDTVFTTPFEDPPELVKQGLGFRRNPDGTPYVNPETNSFEIMELPGTFKQQRLAEEEAERARQEVATGSKAFQANKALSAVSSITEILDRNPRAVGTVSRLTQVIAETDAAAIRGHVRTLKSPIVLGRMVELKEASKQGATGFGNMNQKELETLIDAMGALDPDGNPDVFRATMDSINFYFDRVVADIRRNVSPEKIKELGLESILQTSAEMEKMKVQVENVPNGFLERETNQGKRKRAWEIMIEKHPEAVEWYK